MISAIFAPLLSGFIPSYLTSRGVVRLAIVPHLNIRRGPPGQLLRQRAPSIPMVYMTKDQLIFFLLCPHWLLCSAALASAPTRWFPLFRYSTSFHSSQPLATFQVNKGIHAASTVPPSRLSYAPKRVVSLEKPGSQCCKIIVLTTDYRRQRKIRKVYGVGVTVLLQLTARQLQPHGTWLHGSVLDARCAFRKY